ncbi:hypothetical protein [Streptomyces violascens]|uniref:Uncharacterized protein n=1 Tax=Streptomyces violascens TaxID=67381 RepID=A0ABQ3QSB4_9ACTN|nr:hypothetical protein [Streptomyces violascens]GGU47968.1 hypothetical protein GCM10010289_80660 [Streptomyces violascens]GHI40153.1 hypothetical protein Sviol_45610 [Streptomyces violascens]
MDADDTMGWESVELDGGPGHGLRVRVAGRPGVLQVTYPCAVEPQAENVSVHALFIYRRDTRRRTGGDQPVRYGFDAASP